MAKLTVHFTTDLGANISIEIEEQQLLDSMRRYGRRGWTSGEIPTGGYHFPYDNEVDFDWALLGARTYKNSEGETVVWHRGHTYRRRDLEAVSSKKMTLPAAVKYSRGAKPTDPAHLREQSDGDFEYITLAVFRGGKRRDEYAIPTGNSQARDP